MSFMIRLLLATVLLLGQARARLVGTASIPPDTVDELDVNAYAGNWYQMYTSFLPNITFEKGGFCVTATYAQLPSPPGGEIVRLSVLNSQRIGAPDGELDQISGVATNPKFGEEPGKFALQFEDMAAIGSYWIVATGAIPPGETLYPWAIVSTPFQIDLFILARDVAVFKEVYEEEVLDLVKKKLFIFPYNKPLETYQGPDCLYPF